MENKIRDDRQRKIGGKRKKNRGEDRRDNRRGKMDGERSERE